MTFYPTLPASSPAWFRDFARSTVDLFRRPMPAPFLLKQYPTADLPPAANHKGAIVYDSTTDTVKQSDGTDWTDYQPTGADLTALEALATTGLVARTGAATYSTRTLTAPAAGLSVANGGGVAGNPTFALANDLAALEGLSGTGLARRTGADAWSTITYEEGTFTPSLLFGGASTGMTFLTQGGRYLRAGSLVFVTVRMALTAKGSSTGTAFIGGLPYAANVNPPRSALALQLNNMSGLTVPCGNVVEGTTQMTLLDFAGGTTSSQMTEANFTNTSVIVATVTYVA